MARQKQILRQNRFVCFETGNIVFDLIQVLPGGKHSLETSFKILRD